MKRGEWEACSTEMDGLKLQAVSFLDMQIMEFISTCSTALPGLPRKTKHSGDISRPHVAYEYLNAAAAIDIHNHARTGGLDLEDVWMTHDPILRQFAGIMGFLFTNAYLACTYFKYQRLGKPVSKHHGFMISLSNQLTSYDDSTQSMNRRLSLQSMSENGLVNKTHVLEKLSHPQNCYYCRHAFEKNVKSSTAFGCSFCKVPMCKPTTKGRACWNDHIEKGLPNRKYRQTKKTNISNITPRK